MILQQINHHPIFKYHPVRFGRHDLDGRERHLPRITQRQLSREDVQYGKQRRHEHHAEQYPASCAVYRFTVPTRHRVTSLPDPPAMIMSLSFLTSTPTVRLVLVKY